MIPTAECTFCTGILQVAIIKKDVDDNKFIDCYVAANAEYLLTHDAGFKTLKTLPFPVIRVISLDEFKVLYFNRL